MAPRDPRVPVPQCCWFCGAVQGVTVAPEPGEVRVIRVTGCACAPVYLVEYLFWAKAAPHLTLAERDTVSTALSRAAATHPLPRVDLSLVTPRGSTS